MLIEFRVRVRVGYQNSHIRTRTCFILVRIYPNLTRNLVKPSFIRQTRVESDLGIIVILATSSLDAESETVLQDALIVAHWLSTIRGVENVAVVQDGCITEQGSHS